MGSSKPRVAVTIQYKELPLSYSFAGGISTVVRDSTPHVIEAIYYNDTNTGYWFGDADSYSTYGMITKVVEQRGMSTGSGGVVVPGQVTKQADYNYPLTTTNASGRTNGLALTDAPTYETLSESWAGADVAGPAITTYKIQNNTSPRTTTVIQPNGTVSRQYSYNSAGQYYDGLVYLDETYIPDTNGTYTIPNVTGTFKMVGKSNVAWGSGNYNSPRPTDVEVFDENGSKVKTQYTYGTGKFNQITRSCDYDNSNTLLQCSNAEYENATAYVGNFDTSGWFTYGRHIFNLVKSSEIEDAQGNRVSRTEYEYDNYSGNPLRDAPNVVHHNYQHDPYTSQQTYGACILYGPPYNCGTEYEPMWCDECIEWEMVSAYDPSTEKRGNVTKVTTYSNAQNLTGAVVETRSYDKTGNVVRVSSACCEETSISYDNPGTTGVDSQYAYPYSQTRGSADINSPHRITTFSNYDFRTGLLISTTDANGRISTNEYDANTLRLIKATASTGAYSTLSYDDAGMTITEEVKEANSTLAGKTVKHLNGVGQVRKEESYAPNSIVDIVETKYTQFGEEWKQSRPYRSGDTVHWSERFYDSQGRLIKIVEPDGSETKAFYNETMLPDSVTSQPGNRIRVMDAWGRERWGRYDQQGRLVQVVEPNPDSSANPTASVFASGSLLTKYSYDTQNRLVQTEQGAQIRKFKFDDLGRLTRQKLAEQTATLNDAGAYIGAGQSGANWSNAFFYDGRSNLTQKTDARGIKSLYSYDFVGGGQDPLNRIQQISYDHSGPKDTSLPIYQSQPTFYTYMTSGDKTRVHGIYTQAILAEEFSYDVEGRVSTNTKTVQYRANHPFVTSYLYDTLDRVKEVTYPAQYGLAGDPRKVVAHTYDTASRLSGMTIGGQAAASDIVYNAADQTTQMKVGTAGTNQVTEDYTFDPQTGLLTNQKATKNGSTTLLDLTYQYNRGNSAGSLNGKTGHLTKIVNNLDTNKNREYEFDALGRLTKAKGGTTGTLWNQNYSYDRYGNRTNVAASGTAADSSPIPIDGIPNLAYDNATNRITTTGFEYDVNGNQTRALAEDGTTWLKFDYDSANRLRGVKKDDANQTVLEWTEYAADNARLLAVDSQTNQWTIYASVGGTTLAEYREFTSHTPTWIRSNIYLGSSQLATLTPNGSGGEATEYNHPDRLGTRTTTNQQTGSSSEQAHLPFGRPLDAESSVTTNSQRFTSYERNSLTGLDYAINRTYDSKQGRFTQVDPIGMQAVSLASPQTLNLYSYCINDPVNYVDPAGLFLGGLFRWIWRAVQVVVAVILAIVAVVAFSTGQVGAGIQMAMTSAQIFANVFGLRTLQRIISIASIAISVVRIHLSPLTTVPIFPIGGGGGGGGISPGSLFIFASIGAINSFASVNNGKHKKQTACSSHERILQIASVKSALDAAWDRSKYGTNQSHEEAGLLATNRKTGNWKPYEFPRTKPDFRPKGFGAWAGKTVRMNRRGNNFRYYYHTHPYQKFEQIGGETAGSPWLPSDDDYGVSKDSKLPGVLVTKDYFVVFDSSKVLCTFRR